MRIYISIIFCLIFVACKTNQDPFYEQIFSTEMDEAVLDTLTVSASRIQPGEDPYALKYHPSHTRTHDLLHTKLKLSFDWTKEQVIGEAELTFRPIREDKALLIDAVGFDIFQLRLDGLDANYAYDQKQIRLDLGDAYSRTDSFFVKINYIAKPSESKENRFLNPRDKGLFFINPQANPEGPPQQIWTQGETENNSRWFPTIDKPNERCTQEIYLTVDNKFQTLSNGLLIDSQLNGDGSRTDYWKQSLPHAPYLFMVAVGEFDVVESTWGELPLAYFVDKGFGPHAERIFNHTEEMLSFFSELIDYEYPWEKYAQIVVNDFVSGAMENTTAVIFGDFVQKHSRELIDDHNDLIVAHEIFHHWFGNLSTCESWANLTMNEGFANYAEYLWLEHKYGIDHAQIHRMEELRSYVLSCSYDSAHPLIDFHYEDPDDMFDAHSYNKGGLVLHMLRNYLGDALFFSGLNKFLVDHSYDDVEAHDLRIAMEDISGEDLNWFFDQWFFSTGHPSLEVNYKYLESTNQVQVVVEQTQDPEAYIESFTLHPHLAIYNETDTKSIPLVISKRIDTILISDIDEKPLAVSLDGKGELLAVINETRDSVAWEQLFLKSNSVLDRYNALLNISDLNKDELIRVGAADNHPIIRAQFISYLNQADELSQFIAKESHSVNQIIALRALKRIDKQAAYKSAQELAKKEHAFRVVPDIISAISNISIEEAAQYAKETSRGASGYIHHAIFPAYSKTNNPEYLDEFDKALEELNLMYMFPFLKHYKSLAAYASPERILLGASKMAKIAMHDKNAEQKRFYMTSCIVDLKNMLENRDKGVENGKSLRNTVKALNKLLEEIVQKEQDPGLLSKYESLLANNG